MTDPHKDLADEMRERARYCADFGCAVAKEAKHAREYELAAQAWLKQVEWWYGMAERIEAMGGEQEQAAVEGSGPQPHGTEPHPPATPCRCVWCGLDRDAHMRGNLDGNPDCPGYEPQDITPNITLGETNPQHKSTRGET